MTTTIDIEPTMNLQPINTICLKNYYWTTRPDGCAVLYQPFEEPIPYLRSSLLFAISNVKAERPAYQTEEAWLKRLEMFQEGLYYAKV